MRVFHECEFLIRQHIIYALTDIIIFNIQNDLIDANENFRIRHAVRICLDRHPNCKKIDTYIYKHDVTLFFKMTRYRESRLLFEIIHITFECNIV